MFWKQTTFTLVNHFELLENARLVDKTFMYENKMNPNWFLGLSIYFLFNKCLANRALKKSSIWLPGLKLVFFRLFRTYSRHVSKSLRTPTINCSNSNRILHFPQGFSLLFSIWYVFLLLLHKVHCCHIPLRSLEAVWRFVVMKWVYKVPFMCLSCLPSRLFNRVLYGIFYFTTVFFKCVVVFHCYEKNIKAIIFYKSQLWKHT